MAEPKIEQLIRELQALDAEYTKEIASLKDQLDAKEKELAAQRAIAINPDALDDMETRKITKDQLLANKVPTGHTSKVDEAKAKADARSLRVIGAALPKIAGSAQLREVIGRSIRYYIKTPVTESFQQLLDGDRPAASAALGTDGRKLEDGDLLDDTASPLGLGIGLAGRGIALRERKLNCEQKYKDIMLSCLRHYMDQALDAKLKEMTNNIGASIEDQIRGLVPDLPSD